MDIPSLAETFKNDFAIGAALEPNQTSGLSADTDEEASEYASRRECDEAGFIQPVEGHFQWDQADQIVAFAKENDIAVRFHTLVWHSQVPDWFFPGRGGQTDGG